MSIDHWIPQAPSLHILIAALDGDSVRRLSSALREGGIGSFESVIGVAAFRERVASTRPALALVDLGPDCAGYDLVLAIPSDVPLRVVYLLREHEARALERARDVGASGCSSSRWSPPSWWPRPPRR